MSFNPSIAAALLSSSMKTGQHLDELPAECRPVTRLEGYAVQALWPNFIGPVGGWKIAATSLAGQRHIGVSGPLVGPIFSDRIHQPGVVVSLEKNRMRVAECEIVFRFEDDLCPREQGWSLMEVLKRVSSVHPGIEVPDSRFLQFESAGEAQLIADCACSNDMVLGLGIQPTAELLNGLSALKVKALMRDGRQLEGVGSHVLGDPLEALRWFVNEITGSGQTIKAGQFVTTGACVVPIPILPGHQLRADFDWLGQMTVDFT